MAEGSSGGADRAGSTLTERQFLERSWTTAPEACSVASCSARARVLAIKFWLRRRGAAPSASADRSRLGFGARRAPANVLASRNENLHHRQHAFSLAADPTGRGR